MIFFQNGSGVRRGFFTVTIENEDSIPTINTKASKKVGEQRDENISKQRNTERPKPKDKLWLLDLESKLSLVGGKENAETKEHKEHFTTVSNCNSTCKIPFYSLVLLNTVILFSREMINGQRNEKFI